MSFHISALDPSQFMHLFHLPADELARRRARRMIADKKPGFPCRISLADAEIGEEVILVHYEHQTADTPFRSSHGICVRPHANRALLAQGEVPASLRTRVLSLRGFDETGMMIGADLAEGAHLESAIATMFQSASVGYLHLHFAKPGCYAARVDRA